MNAPAMHERATGVRERKERRAPGLRATLGPFLHPYRASLLAAAGFSVLQSASELAQPWPLALAVDYAVGRPRLTGALAGLGSLSPVSFALLAAGVSVVLVGVSGLMGYLVEYLSGAVGARIGSDIRVAASGGSRVSLCPSTTATGPGTWSNGWSPTSAGSRTRWWPGSRRCCPRS